MDKSPSNNIFDEASKKRLVNAPKKAIQDSLPSDLSKVKPQMNPEIPLTEFDIEVMFKNVKEMQRDLDNKSGDLKDTIASSPQDVIRFFNDSKNFTPEQWNIIQNNRSDLENKVWAVIGKDPKKALAKRSEDKETRQRKAKSIGSRHNWIPMR